jgi:hypothetical protein
VLRWKAEKLKARIRSVLCDMQQVFIQHSIQTAANIRRLGFILLEKFPTSRVWPPWLPCILETEITAERTLHLVRRWSQENGEDVDLSEIAQFFRDGSWNYLNFGVNTWTTAVIMLRNTYTQLQSTALETCLFLVSVRYLFLVKIKGRFLKFKLAYVWKHVKCIISIHPSTHPTNGATAQLGPWPPPLRFLNHTELDTW